MAASTSTAAATTSGPTPSPGMRAISRTMSVADCRLRVVDWLWIAGCGLYLRWLGWSAHPQPTIRNRQPSTGNLYAVSVPDFLGAGTVAMAGALCARRGLRGAEVGDDLHELGVADGLLLIGERHHAAIETIELEARQLEAELLHAVLHG